MNAPHGGTEGHLLAATVAAGTAMGSPMEDVLSRVASSLVAGVATWLLTQLAAWAKRKFFNTKGG